MGRHSVRQASYVGRPVKIHFCKDSVWWLAVVLDCAEGMKKTQAYVTAAATWQAGSSYPEILTETPYSMTLNNSRSRLLHALMCSRIVKI